MYIPPSRVASFRRKHSVSYFNLGSKLGNFSDITVDSAIPHEEGELVKKALVAVEGTFDDSNGNSHTFSVDRLNTIAAHTNAALNTGNTIPVCQDHSKTVESTVGSVNGFAYVKPVTEADLPNSKSTHLLGKIGLFLDDVCIKAPAAIQKVAGGIVTSVSMGLNLDPKEHRIMELSLVPIPAIPNMGLFKHKSANFMADSDDSQAFTWEDMEADSIAMDELKEEYDDLTDSLWRLISNIYTSDAVNITDVNTLKQYVYSALNGYSIRVMDLLGLNDQVDQTMSQDSTADVAAMNSSMMQQQQMTQAQDLSQPSIQQGFNKRTSGLINFRKKSLYIR